MPTVSPIQDNFNSGEWSPLMAARSDLDKYGNALDLLVNFIPTVQGPLKHRPGTPFVAEAKDSTKATRVKRFEFSTTQAYILEFGDLYVRFYRDNGRIESPPGTPVEVVTPYLEAELFELKFVQSADVLYIVHPNHAQRTLTRTSHIAWTLTTLSFIDGPYFATNSVAANTMTPSGVTGSITLTMVNPTFVSTDVGRLVRFKDSANNWTWLTITAFTSDIIVTATVSGADLASTAATFNWRLGAWSDTTGYPGAVTFHEDRLTFGGATDTPQRCDLSRTGLYTTFSPTEINGTVSPDNAISFTLNSRDVQVIKWLESDEKALLAGTVAGEWLIRASTQGEALSAAQPVSAKETTSHGSANVDPVRVGRGTLFVQTAASRLREMAYQFEVDGFRAGDLTTLAEHISRGPTKATSGIVELAYQKNPQSIVWAVRKDGTLLALTHERDQDVIGWHRHVLGGNFSGGAPVVESVAVIPAPDGTRDELWMVAKWTINAVTKRYIVYMEALDDETVLQDDSFFVDCGLTYSGVPATTISGLDHLEGETVQILSDGATHPDKVVSSGSIELDRLGSTIHVGLYANADGRLMRVDAGSATGTSQGKTKRISYLTFRFLRTLGWQHGPSFDKLDEISFRTSEDPTATAVPLFTGDKTVEFDGDWDGDGFICFRQPYPLPATLLMVAPTLETQDR